jgi:hypothetical protein
MYGFTIHVREITGTYFRRDGPCSKVWRVLLGARSVRAAALFCPLVEEPEREAGPAAMGPPPWGSEHGLYVVVVNAGGALMGREPQLQLPVHMRLKVHD